MEPGQLIGEWVRWEDAVVDLELGDLLEFRRTANVQTVKRQIYSHWALFIGRLEGVPRVVHISTPDGDFGALPGDGKIKDSISGIGLLKTIGRAEVRCDRLEHVSGDDLMRINNGCDQTNRPFPPSIIVERATSKLGEGSYNVVFNNCEHFAKWCRYGNKISSQAVAAKSLALSSLLMGVTNPFLALGIGMSFYVSADKLSRIVNRSFAKNFGLF